MPRQGWTRLAGTAERYLSPSGEEVSRRQYDNARFEELGYSSRSEYERRYEDSTYQWAFDEYARNYGLLEARGADRAGGELAELLHEAQRTGWGKGDRSADGPMAKLLVELGKRDPAATYLVGDTDRRKR